VPVVVVVVVVAKQLQLQLQLQLQAQDSNMMYLEERDSFRKIGLLDFQDALCGSPVYDLVSVLEDARFDVDALELIDYFVKKKNLTGTAKQRSCFACL